VFRNFAVQIKALRDLGLSKKQIREILRKERIGKEELKALERGRYLPYSPSEAKLEEADEKNHDVPTRTLRILERELRRLSIDPEDPDPTPEGAFDTDRLSPRRDTKRRIITEPTPTPAPQPAPPATTTPPPATVNTSAASPAMGQISVEDLIQDPRTAQIARRRTMVG
jgi:DNA-binding transcriptional MerR regulator